MTEGFEPPPCEPAPRRRPPMRAPWTPLEWLVAALLLAGATLLVGFFAAIVVWVWTLVL